MKIIELDSHPLIEAFRTIACNFKNDPSLMYHLLLPPEYNIGNLTDPLLYLFVEDESNMNILKQYGNGKYVLKQENNILIPIEGFDHKICFEILQTTPCSTTNGFTFEMEEVAVNPFIPSPIPPLCNEIQVGYENPSNALQFLKTRIRSPALPAVLQELEAVASKTKITISNRYQVLEMIHSYMDKISDIVFTVVPFHYIPTMFKMRTNFIIFYAVANLFHAKLLKVYHSALEKDNREAQKAVREPVSSIGDPVKLDKAATHLRNLHQMKNVESGIKMVTDFFDGVMASLPDANAAADDILPAVCDGMSRYGKNSSYLVSSFQYLAEIWQSDGLDQKITYILVTCSIAASHFASGPRMTPIEKPIRKI
ncbi:hypothetical protein GPJ56_000898 [Histomonas meleagridis]|uniref:uncharacterized protein n=1 Tax=Histomonas meleagridis TaxID=135588 RepID=UPI003559AADF|nr:hypothetical protein GPJ56_000898 [Histomonas meleagridis]KAH0801272.1 hypothetical protein GO595_005867 [Histomonas meleagridis]